MTPPFYDPHKIGTLFLPDLQTIAGIAESASVEPVSPDSKDTTALLLIDFQVDFCHPSGSLCVPGALGDLRRTVEFLYEHLGKITQVYASLDTHHAFQIFHPLWWVNDQGRHPEPFTQITEDDVTSEKWRPVAEPDWSKNYIEQLESEGRQMLTIWPYHAMIGSAGQALDPVLFEAVLYHSFARKVPVNWIRKGDILTTEHYSIFEPEVTVPGAPGGSRFTELLDILSGFDRIFIAGEAKSHCVLSSLRTLVEHFDDPKILGKFHLLTDCTSPVAHPEIDFEERANSELEGYEERGLRLTSSDSPSI